MLTYGVMILNHYRLCQYQTHPHLPINLVELFQATQQIGAFQVRVQQSLSQVLFSSLQRPSFWQHWANWVLQMLAQWTDTAQSAPSICHTPGLLPLSNTDGAWSWKETIVIQAMALEAAHQLVESLPLESMDIEALGTLLGLQDALVEDSSTIDPKGFEMIPLGIPLLPNAIGGITVQSEELDPTLRRLPKILVQSCPQAPLAISAPQVLSHWIWDITQQLGMEVSAVGLFLTTQMAQATLPWQSAIAVTGTEGMTRLGGQSGSSTLQTFARRVELLCQSNLQWEERQLEHKQVHRRQEKLWTLEMLQISQTLLVEGGHSGGVSQYGEGEVEAVQIKIAPGRWCERLIEHYGEEVIQGLLEFSQIAQHILAIDASNHRFAAKVAVFLAHQRWQGKRPESTVGEILKAVEPIEKIQGLASNAIRRDVFFQEWALMLAQFQGVGWLVPNNPLQGWEKAPLGAMDWLEEPIAIRLQANATVSPIPQSIMPLSSSDEGTHPPTTRGCMEKISSHSLERALASRGMSQAKLARSLNLDRSTINRWINGSRPIHPRYRPMLWELLGAELQN